MTNTRLHSLDIRLLRYFAVVAQENNMSRAAQRLFISQPPLSRHISYLEELLGTTLFIRHSRGLILTAEGQRALEIIQPLLAQQEQVLEALSQLAVTPPVSLRLGLTTAFEQGIFTGLESALSGLADNVHLVRHASPVLAQQVRKGRLDAALVALPLKAEGLDLRPLSYREPLIAALPAAWAESSASVLRLSSLNSRPLFWFKRERHPAFFDYTRRIFERAGYAPVYVEEPVEHDVLLARIARAEGMILVPASFAAIQRQGVVFKHLDDADPDLAITLGLATMPDAQALCEKLVTTLDKAWC